MAEGNIKLSLCYFRHIWLIISWFPVLKIHFNLPKKTYLENEHSMLLWLIPNTCFPANFAEVASPLPPAFPTSPTGIGIRISHASQLKTYKEFAIHTHKSRHIVKCICKMAAQKGAWWEGGSVRVGEWDLHVLLIMFMPSVTAAHDIQLPQIKIRQGLRENSDLFEE